MPRALPVVPQRPQLCVRSRPFHPYNLRSRQIGWCPSTFFVINVHNQDLCRIKQVLPRCWTFKSTTANKTCIATSYCPDVYVYNLIRNINPLYYFHLGHSALLSSLPAGVSDYWINPLDQHLADVYNLAEDHPWYPEIADYLALFQKADFWN